ncbi:MAG: hypothetical protein ACR2RB_02420 [Gammaproteobacteria bacterium]
MTTSVEEIVRQEIEDLHMFFIGWFSGAILATDFDVGFLARFGPDFRLIPPAGSILTLDELAASVRKGYGTNPDFRIAIRNVTVRRVLDSHILATYEEWQRNALASTPPENARIATVLFDHSEPLRWLHIHETRMRSTVDAYDF